MKKYRAPIVAVLGHVDSGKTTLLDYIRKTRVVYKEPGMITQHIGCSEIPLRVLEEICKPILEKFKFPRLDIEGLIFIDLPGHEAFTNLRRRGGSVADIAILVIDVGPGIQPQTVESIEILKSRNTPFVIALNKIDRLPGWKSVSGRTFLESIKAQEGRVIDQLETRTYDIVAQLSQYGIQAERYDRVRDFKIERPIVPVSAITGEGVPDLLAVLLGMAQRYMLDRLEITSEAAIGTVLEVKETPGLGITMDAIIYDGILRKGDTLVVGGKEGPIVTYVRGIFRPQPLDEMRAPREKFIPIDKAVCAAGVKIAAPNIENVVAGSPLYVALSKDDVEKLKKQVQEELGEILIKSEKEGFIIKADTLGSLEAIISTLKRMDLKVRKADIGDISENDIFEASVSKRIDPLYGCVLGFNVKVHPKALEEAEKYGVKIFTDNIIYQLIEKIEEYTTEMRTKKEMKILQQISYPCKIEVLPGYIFRRSKPAIVGVKILEGKLIPGSKLLSESGKIVGKVLEIQDKGNKLPIAEKGMEVAVSIEGGVVGRNIHEKSILYSLIPLILTPEQREYLENNLSPEEKKLLKEIWKMVRKIA
ncbi:MAG: translation initiation factor IF-2 [Thermoproteota archaeon]|nr:MAG: translation initiation factor IF-2 [Candidatus Korarchaeota archaeon]